MLFTATKPINPDAAGALVLLTNDGAERIGTIEFIGRQCRAIAPDGQTVEAADLREAERLLLLRHKVKLGVCHDN